MATKLSKRTKAIRSRLTVAKAYAFADAVELLKSLPPLKFRESVDISVNLGVDARQSDQTVRGAVVLPFGTGKTVRVAVFTQGKNAEAAKAAGADVVGMDDLAQAIQGGMLDFDVVIASPDAMGVVGRLGQILGPRGLMPNPKVGTVSMDVATAVKNAKSGQVRYRSDKNGIVHGCVGKVDFSLEALKANVLAVLDGLRKAKPSTAKGIYLKKITLSTTMGPGLMIDQASFDS
ncbi:MAG: 50S ribosomal protein L1 [Gammaproteobacteria bacterium]|nr:50S ribosomal protein L1 [Gammaproteobacteria bacterium]MBP9729288.1 50S ribosomal protein L1 [Gammaproteobacteria bacterium]